MSISIDVYIEENKVNKETGIVETAVSYCYLGEDSQDAPFTKGQRCMLMDWETWKIYFDAYRELKMLKEILNK